MSHDQADLFAGERVLWQGAPTRYPMFTRADAFVVPFSLFWCGFAIFWTVTAVAAGAPVLFLVVGTIFVAIGLYMVVGRLLARRLRLRSTTYTVTDRRVVVRSKLFGRQQERSAYLNALPPPVLASGTGTITFGNSTLFDELRAAQGMFMPSAPFHPELVAVNDSRHVRDIIAAAQTPGRT